MHLRPLASLTLSFQFVFAIRDHTDPTEDTTDLFTLDSSLMDDMPIEDSDLFEPSFSQVPDQFLTSSAELTAANGESCIVGKKRDGASCSVPLTLEIPNVLDVFGIEDGSDDTGPDAHSDANAWDWKNIVNPCLLEAPYIIHLCCHGPLGAPYGNGWTFLDKCFPGAYLSLYYSAYVV